MELEVLLVLLTVGLIAGFLAGLVTQGHGFGLAGNIAVGLIGAVFGYYLSDLLHLRIGTGFVSDIVSATLGAILFLYILRLVR
jgi:uncharacterized membrane protein YeaQ/YmgE (transglycosylase-associated protein family)